MPVARSILNASAAAPSISALRPTGTLPWSVRSALVELVPLEREL